MVRVEEIGRRAEIGVEDRHQLAGGGLQPFLQRAGLEAVAVGAVVILDGVAQRPVALHQRLGEGRGIVGGIVQHLNLQQFLGILDLDHLFDQPLHHVALVVKRKLDGHRRQLFEALRRPGSGLLPVLEIRADDLVAVDAVNREDDQNREVGDQHGPVEPRHLVDAGEGVVEQAPHQTVGGGMSGQERQRQT